MKTLERRLGLTSIVAISIGAMLGSGLFVLPGLAAGYTGPSVWLAYVVAGLGVLPTALSKSELATAMPESGGTYVYIDRTFGPLAGTVAGLGLWLSLLLKSAFALVGFGAYLSIMTAVPLKPVALALLAVVVSLNILGVRKVGKMQAAVVVVVIVSLSLTAGRGFLTLRPSYLEPAFSHGGLGFWTAVSFVYISYAGVTKVSAIAEEVENPGRNLPLGMLVSLALVTVLYGGVTFALAGNVPVEELVGDLHPIYTLADRVGGHNFGLAASVLGVVTMTSMSNSGLLAASRFPFAMSRNDLLPGFLRHISSRFMTPVPAILVTGSLMGAAILFLDVASIAKLASSLMIVAFLAVNLAVIVLRESDVRWYKPSFKSPLYPYTQIAGVVLCLSLLTMLGSTGVMGLVGIALPGVLLFFAFGRQKTDRKGVLGRLGPRHELLARQPQLVLPKKAAVVVPLLGRGHGAEALAELGDALAGGSKVEVVHIMDVPEQISLALTIEDPVAESLRRRIERVAKERKHDIEFDTLATHDHIRAVHDISRRVNCEWLVMEWRGHSENGVLPFNPLGWLVNHLSCNLAVYKDVGSRTTKRILAFTEPGPHDALVAMTADHLARVYGAELTFARFVHVDAPEHVVRAERAYIDQLCALCEGETKGSVVRGHDEVLEMAALSSEFDLLVVSSPDVSIWSQLRGTRADRLMRRAACSVLRLKAPRRLTERTLSRDPVGDLDRLAIDDFLVGDCVEVGLHVKSKQALFAHLSQTFSRVVEGVSAQQIEDALWERERAQNTAIERGMAIPHATVAAAKRSYVGVFTTSEPVDYRAPDNVPVDVFVVTVGPASERNTHLRILSSLARLVTKTLFLERVRAADNATELMAVLLASSTLDPELQTEPMVGSRPPPAQEPAQAGGDSGTSDQADPSQPEPGEANPAEQ